MKQAAKYTDEDFAHLIVRHATDSMVFTDPDGLFLWANQPFFEMSGFALDECVGKKPGSLLQGADTDPETVSQIRDAVNAKRVIRTEIINYTKTGVPYWIDLTITPVYDAKGKLIHFMSIERDVTESKEMARKTRDALDEEQERRRERRVLSQMSEWLFAAQTLEELQAVVTRSMSQLFPQARGELYIYSNSRDVLDLVSSWGDPNSVPHLSAAQCWGLRRGRAYAFGTSEIDFCCEHVNSEQNPYFCLPIIAHGDTIGLLHIAFPELEAERSKVEEINEHLAMSFEVAQICAEQISLAAANVRLQAELQDQSVKDVLTGLWNRRWFLDMANRELRRVRTAGEVFALAMIDVDHFKKFNDAFGHDAGDAVLKVLASHMLDLEGRGVFPCRVGGEEFAIVFSGLEMTTAQEILDRLRSRLAEAKVIFSGNALPHVTVSAGLAQLSDRNPDLETIMKRADEALYKAKANGRNCTILADEDDTHGKITAAE